MNNVDMKQGKLQENKLNNRVVSLNSNFRE